MNNGIFTSDLDTKIKNLFDSYPVLAPIKKQLLDKWFELKNQKLNIMITGATGSGKSSTINALFNMDAATETRELAKVGVGANPETMVIDKYELGNMVLWDTPGLGDGYEADNRHANFIARKLSEQDENGEYLIDLVLVILDGGSRDLGTSYELINEVIIPCLGNEKDKSKRILVAINQADNAMKGRYWDYENNCPEQKLVEFLEEKCESIRRRIKESTGVDVEPVYYSAGFKEEGQPQGYPYNLAKLMDCILEHIPTKKRISAVNPINPDPKMWKGGQTTPVAWQHKLQECITTAFKGAALGGTLGAAVGSVIPVIGTAVGAAVGTVIGGLVTGIASLFG